MRWQRGWLTDLTPGWVDDSQVVEANERGEALVQGVEAWTIRQHVAVWSHGRLHELDIGRPSVEGRGFNEASQALLYSYPGYNAVWTRGRVQELPPAPPGGRLDAYHLGDGGHVVGTVADPTEPGAQFAFVWKGGALTRLDIPVDGTQDAVDVDRYGRVLVNVRGGPGEIVAGIWDRGRWTELGAFTATDMNDRAQAVGAVTTPGGTERAALWTGRELVDLGTLGGRWSFGLALSNTGFVAGVSGDDSNNPHAFLWACGTMIDLATSASTDNSRAVDVNDFGQVISSRQFELGPAWLSTPTYR